MGQRTVYKQGRPSLGVFSRGHEIQTNVVCWDCREGRRCPARVRKEHYPKCPKCGNTMSFIGRRWRIPKKRHKQAWKRLRRRMIHGRDVSRYMVRYNKKINRWQGYIWGYLARTYPAGVDPRERDPNKKRWI